MKKPTFKLPILLALSFAAALVPANAQLVTYTFPDGDHDISVAAASVAAGITATAITHVNLATGANAPTYPASLQFGGDGNLDSMSTYNSSQYLDFSLTPQTGNVVDLAPTDTLSFTVGIQDAGANNPAGVDVMYSTDGFATSTDLGSTAITASSGQAVSLNLGATGALAAGTSGEFRFYFDGAGNSYETGDIGDIVLDGMVISAGSPPAVPEPTSCALMLGGLASLIIFGMRRSARS